MSISNKYILDKLINQGAFGKIYTGQNKFTNENVIIKLEDIKNEMNLLQHEAKILNILKNVNNIPKIKMFGLTKTHNYMVIDKLSHSLEYLKRKCGGSFQLKTILQIGMQLLTIIEDIHNAGVLHRDIKPDNILIGSANKLNQIYLIDFGLSNIYVDEKWNHKPISNNKSVIGTLSYISLNVHNGIEYSRRDDLISIGYILIYFFKGKLPWQNISCNDINQKTEIIKNIKKTEFINLIKSMPFEFIIYFNYCNKLKYDEKPNYKYLKNLFKNLLELQEQERKSSKFEWIELL